MRKYNTIKYNNRGSVMTFGEFIKAKRKEKLLSQRRFAEMIGLSPVYVSYFENGKRNAPKHEILLRIAEVMNLNDQQQSQMMFLAAQQRYHNRIPNETAEYLCENEYAKDALRLAQECKITDDDWRFITNYICNKYL